MTDIDMVLKKLEPVKDVPKTTRGGFRHTWKPILDFAIGKGYFRISEKDVSIASAINGLQKEAERQKVKAILNTRRIDGITWLFITVKK